MINKYTERSISSIIKEMQIKLKARKRKEKRRAEINEFENRKKTPIKQKASLKRSIKLTNFQPD